MLNKYFQLFSIVSKFQTVNLLNIHLVILDNGSPADNQIILNTTYPPGGISNNTSSEVILRLKIAIPVAVGGSIIIALVITIACRCHKNCKECCCTFCCDKWLLRRDKKKDISPPENNISGVQTNTETGTENLESNREPPTGTENLESNRK